MGKRLSVSGRATALVCALLVTTPASGLVSQALAPRGPISERFLSQVQVAGAEILGVQAKAGDLPANSAQLSVFLPTHLTGRLCVAIASYDGKYNGRVEYDVSGLPAGRYRLQYPTEFRSSLAQYRAADVGVLAELKRRCEVGDRAEAIVVASWDPVAALDSVTILLNSLSADSVTLDGVRCRRVATVKHVAYDWSCVAKAGSGTARLGLKRFYLGDPRPDTLVVRVP